MIASSPRPRYQHERPCSRCGAILSPYSRAEAGRCEPCERTLREAYRAFNRWAEGLMRDPQFYFFAGFVVGAAVAWVVVLIAAFLNRIAFGG